MNNFYENWLRNFILLEWKRRISLMPYLIIAMRSIPMPKANPEYIVGSMPLERNTLGCTMPVPSSSIQRVCLHTEHPVVQKGHEASISNPGSTKGKNPGRTRISNVSLSNILRKKVCAVANKLLTDIFLSTNNISA